MRIQGNTMFKLVGSLALCGFLLGTSDGAGAATKKEVGKPATGSVTAFGMTAPPPDNPAYCESSCCWASGEHVVCSESGCYAESGDESAEYICDQT